MNTNTTVMITDAFIDRLIDNFRTKMLEEKRHVHFRRVQLKDAPEGFVEDLAYKFQLTITPFKDGSGVALVGYWALVVLVFTDPDSADALVYAVESGVDDVASLIKSGRVFG